MRRLAVVVALLAAPALAAGDPRLVGAWTLVAATATAADGSPRPLAFVDSSGPATGLLVYTADGTVAVQIAGTPRPAVSRAGTDPEGAAAARSYYAYTGRYEADPARRRIVHHVVASLWPGEAGASYARTYTLTADRLTFDSDPQTVNGERVVNRLVWDRVRP